MDSGETESNLLALREHLQVLQRQLAATGDLMLKTLQIFEVRLVALEGDPGSEGRESGTVGAEGAAASTGEAGNVVPQEPTMVWSRREVQEADSAMRRLDTLEAAAQQAQGLELQEAIGLLAEVSVEHTRILRSFGRLLLALESDLH